MNFQHPAAWVLPLLFFAGCATSPTDFSAVKLPASWQQAGNFPTASPDRDLSQWWASFGDAEMGRLIRSALENSPDIASAVANVRQAQALRKAETSFLFPELNYSGSGSTANTWQKNGADFSSENYSGGLSASWEVDFFGKNRQSVIAASADADAAEANLDSARSSLAAETALAYLQLRASESSLQLVNQSIASQEETTQLAKWRNQAGEIDQLEYDQARATLESARATISTLQQNIGQTRNRLNLLAGRVPGELAITASYHLPQPQSRLAIGIPADTVRQRPDVRSAGYGWLAAIARTRSAEAEKFPSFTLSGNLGTDSLSSSKVFNPQNVSSNLIAGLTGPIFNAGRIRAQIEGQDAAEERAFQNYRASILTALSEVEDALIACRRTSEKIGTLEKAATAARSAADLAAKKYTAGVIDITPVLDTQRNDLAIRQNLITARLDRANAHIELYRALGGGW
ncbi:efflux transporter outer membrane subunit [Luteolibacter algae]|uniref:Efflux transporter outer membrane subunit n=1 Tax=Luteolibacter algae TaxID=454151 RepID=A0ABW5DAL1_9BACT